MYGGARCPNVPRLGARKGNMARKNLNAPEHWAAWIAGCAKDPGSPMKLPKGVLGMCTGQDCRALHAFAAALELFVASDEDGETAGLLAASFLLDGMQRKCWPIAKELIAQQSDWHLRERTWERLMRVRGERASQHMHSLRLVEPEAGESDERERPGGGP